MREYVFTYLSVPIVAASALLFIVFQLVNQTALNRPLVSLANESEVHSKSAFPELISDIDHPTLQQPRLREESRARGINYSHLQQSHGIAGLDETLGSGLCVFDFNKDDSPDLFVVGGSGHTRFYGRDSWWAQKQGSRLYKNDGLGHFEDVSALLDLPADTWGIGCNSADLDQDGYSDLILTSRDSVYLLHNQQGKNLKSIKLYQNEIIWPTSVSIADVNSDSQPDIYIANYLKYDKTAKHFEGASGYTQVTPAAFRPGFYQGQSNLLFINKGQLRFEESASRFNLDKGDGRSLSAHWLDANKDRFIDLLIVNDQGSTTQLYLNNDGKTFTKADPSRHIDLPSGTRSAAIEDIDGDGDADLVFSTIPGESPVILANENQKYTNLTWTKVQSGQKLTGTSGFGVSIKDINNDGYPDLLFANGFQHPDSDSYYVPQGQANSLLLNDGNGNFSLWTPGKNLFSNTLSSRSLAFADFDRDGDSDFVISNNNGPIELYVNHTPNPNWIGFTGDSTRLLNLKYIRVETDRRSLTRYPDTSGFLGSGSVQFSISLMKGETVKQALAHWYGHSETHLKGPDTGYYYRIEKEALTRMPPPKRQVSTPPEPLQLTIWKILGEQSDPSAVASSYENFNKSEKLRLLEVIRNNKPINYLATVQRALESSDIEIIKSAIDILFTTESDSSLHWLSPLFSHQDPGVLCHLSNGFRHLFIEEEAAILRKNLWIPSLIRLLEDPSAEVQVCVLGALGESKSFRAVAPIIRLIDATTDVEVLYGAYAALGELRRTHSADTMKRHLRDSQQRKKLELALQKTLGNLDHSEGISTSEQPVVPPSPPAITKLRQGCIKLSNEKLKTAHPKQFANLFNTCSQLQLSSWLTLNREFNSENYSLFIDNHYISEQVLSTFLSSLSRNPPSGFSDLMDTKIKKRSPKRATYIEALKDYKVSSSTLAILEEILRDPKEPTKNRRLAGDILIHHKSALVLSYSEALFYEH
ncbi:FG-GAP-like repeat-containing protein [Microbulbifer harenosus]|nr:FG-GAP-like repeat-containing protein [Microbulbifer harenosus]